MAFQVFDAYGAAARPEATLRASGYVFLSRGIMKRARNENATHAQLMFDEDEDRLGIRLYDEFDAAGESGVRELTQEKSGTSVNILPLLRYYGFPEPKDLGKQIFPVAFEDGVIVLDLKELRNAKPVPDREKQQPKKEQPKKEQRPTASEEFDDDIPF